MKKMLTITLKETKTSKFEYLIKRIIIQFSLYILEIYVSCGLKKKLNISRIYNVLRCVITIEKQGPGT